LYSESKFEDKCRFLFDIFDFNDLNSISITDLESMLYNCSNSIYRLYGEKGFEIDINLVEDFLWKYFSEENRINIS